MNNPPCAQEMQIPFDPDRTPEAWPWPEPRMLSNSDLKRDLYETIVRRLRIERNVRDGVSTVLLFQVL